MVSPLGPQPQQSEYSGELNISYKKKQKMMNFVHRFMQEHTIQIIMHRLVKLIQEMVIT